MPNVSESPHRARFELALSLAQQAGEVAMRLYQSSAMSWVAKPDGSQVTPADKECETLIRRGIGAVFPQDAILGEEFGESAGQGGGSSGYRWIIDPIDGTSSFVKGVPTFACLIGIEQTTPAGGATRMVAGVAHFPALRETVWALDGQGAWWRTSRGDVVPARVEAHAELATASVQCASGPAFVRAGKKDVHDRIIASVRRTHGWNDAYSFALVATGRFPAVVGFHFSLWDVAPFMAIFREAGAAFTDWSGKTAPIGTALGASTQLHEKLCRVLQDS
jgi:histidinol-phosphatase